MWGGIQAEIVKDIRERMMEQTVFWLSDSWLSVFPVVGSSLFLWTNQAHTAWTATQHILAEAFGFGFQVVQ